MADIPDESLIHTVSVQFFQCVEDLFGLVIRNNTRNNGNRSTAFRQERKHPAEVFRHQKRGRIKKVRFQRGKLRCKLFGSCNLKNSLGFTCVSAVFRHGRKRKAAALRRRHTLFREFGDQFPAQFVDFGRGQKQSLIGFRLVFHDRERSSAGFIHLFDDIVCGDSLALGTLGNRAERRSAVAIVIKSDGFGALALLYQSIEMNRYAADFPVSIGFARLSVQGIKVVILLGFDAEHVGFIAVQVALRKPLARKGPGKQVHLILCRAAFFLQEFGINPRYDTGILGPLHSAFDFHTGYAGLFQCLKTVCKAIVLQRKRIIVHSAAEGILHAAGLRAHPAIAAAAADHGGHVALAGMTETQCAVHKDFRLSRTVSADKANLLQAEFPRQNNAGHAKLGSGFSPCQVMNAHLCAGMKRDIRHRTAQRLCQAEILHQDGIGTFLRSKARGIDRGGHLAVIDERIQRNIYLAVPQMTVPHGFFKFIRRKIMRASPRIKIPETEIYSIRAVLHGGNDSFGRSRRREKFHHKSTPACVQKFIKRFIIAQLAYCDK